MVLHTFLSTPAALHTQKIQRTQSSQVFWIPKYQGFFFSKILTAYSMIQDLSWWKGLPSSKALPKPGAAPHPRTSRSRC